MGREPTDLIRTVFAEVIDGGRYELLPELFTDDFVDHGAMGDNVRHAAFSGYVEMFRAALPDFRHEVIDVMQIADDLFVWAVHVIATFDGEMMGVQGKGQSIDLHSSNACRLRDGKVAEHWGPGQEMMGALLGQMGIPLDAAAPVSAG
jgi:predicted ester cyclase